MIFSLSKKENSKKFLKSLERMIKVTFPEYEIDKETLEKDGDLITTNEVEMGFFRLNDDDEMIFLAKKYLKTFELRKKDHYEFDTVEWRLADIKEIVEVRSFDHPILYIDEYRKIYGRIFNK